MKKANKVINLLNEARPTRVVDKVDISGLEADMFNSTTNPLARGATTGELSGVDNVINQAPPGRTASGSRTRQATSNLRMGSRAASLLSNIDVEPDIISDAEARRNASVDADPTPTRTRTVTEPQLVAIQSNLPALINKQLAKTSTGLAKNKIDPEWHKVKNLPGYLSSSIRSLGRKVFAPFTAVPIEDIQVLAWFDQPGSPNTEQEVKAVATWLQKHGERLVDAELQFQRQLPGYNAEIRIYNALKFDFMVVKDFMGYYIYTYSELGRKQLTPDGNPKLLESLRDFHSVLSAMNS